MATTQVPTLMVWVCLIALYFVGVIAAFVTSLLKEARWLGTYIILAMWLSWLAFVVILIVPGGQPSWERRQTKRFLAKQTEETSDPDE